MLNDSVSTAADHEARNECLIEIDEAWELCRDTIDLARIALEEGLESSRTAYEQRQQKVADEHQASLTEAWNAYKAAITDTPSANRRELITEARDAYKKAAAEIRSTFDQSMGSATDDYAEARKAARAAYDAAVDEAFELHREAVQDVRGFFESTATPVGGDSAVDPLELAAVLAAREHERQTSSSSSGNDGGSQESGNQVSGIEEGELGEDAFLTESAS